MYQKNHSESKNDIALLLVPDLHGPIANLNKIAKQNSLHSCLVDKPEDFSSILSALKPSYILSKKDKGLVEYIQSEIGELRFIDYLDDFEKESAASDSNAVKILLYDSDLQRYALYLGKETAPLDKKSDADYVFSELQLSVYVRSERLKFTRAEFYIFKYLVESKEHVVSKNELAEIALGRQVHPHDRSIDVHICRIRKKLKPVSKHNLISSIRGGGYAFNHVYM